MATHSSIHAWKIPWTEESGGLQSTGSQTVGDDWAISLSPSVCYPTYTYKKYFNKVCENNVQLLVKCQLPPV